MSWLHEFSVEQTFCIVTTIKITKKRALCKYTSTSFIEAVIYTTHSPVAEKLYVVPSTESFTIIQTLTLEKERSFQELLICY